MNYTIEFKNTSLHYRDQGFGDTIVLLHGYLESLEIWDSFGQSLSAKHRVVSIDLLGHGESGCTGAIHTMTEMAEAVNEVLNHLSIANCIMVGHSLGGYVTMAFAALYAEKLRGYCLFHSHTFADTEATIEKRNREIALVREGKKDLIYSTSVPNFFAERSLTKFPEAVEVSRRIALKTSGEGIIAALEGMKIRPDSSAILAQSKLPFLYIIGKRDNLIHIDILKKIVMPDDTMILILENSGHIGFVEEPKRSLEIIERFAKHCFDQ